MMSRIALSYCYCLLMITYQVFFTHLTLSLASLTTLSLQVEVCKRKGTDIPLGWGVNSKGQVRVPV